MNDDADYLRDELAEAQRYVNHYMAERDALAARCTLTDDETEAVRRWLIAEDLSGHGTVVGAVLRRLLGDMP